MALPPPSPARTSLLSVLAPSLAQDGALWTQAAEGQPTSLASVAASFPPLLFSPEGRIGRRDYWLVMTSALLAAVALVVMLAVSLPVPQACAAVAPVVLAYWWVRCCVSVKRWHDLGKPATWILIGLIPLVGWVWALVECGLRPGARGDNEFGPAPK